MIWCDQVATVNPQACSSTGSQKLHYFHVAIWAKIHQVNYKNTFTVTTMSTNDYQYMV